MAELFNIRLATITFLLGLAFCIVIQSCNGQVGSDTQVYGGEKEVPVDDPEVLRLSRLVTAKLTEGDSKERTVVQILKASRQVVSGTLTNMTLKISDGESERLYEATIVEQPWLKKTEILKLEPLDSDNQ